MNIAFVTLYIIFAGLVLLFIEDRMSKSSYDLFWRIIKAVILLVFCYSAPYVAWKFFGIIGAPKDLLLRAFFSAGCFVAACAEAAAVSMVYDAFAGLQKKAACFPYLS